MTPDHRTFSLGFSRALGKVVVHLHGRLDADGAAVLRHRLADVIDGQGNRQLVMDLRDLTGIDPAGFKVLVDARTRMMKVGGELVLSGATREMASAFEAVALEIVFVMTPSFAHPAHGDGPTTSGARRLGRIG